MSWIDTRGLLMILTLYFSDGPATVDPFDLTCDKH